MKMEQSVQKRRHIKFRRLGITQKKTYNIQNTVKVWNQEFCILFVCICVLNYCHPVATQLQLNIYYIISVGGVLYKQLIVYHSYRVSD